MYIDKVYGIWYTEPRVSAEAAVQGSSSGSITLEMPRSLTLSTLLLPSGTTPADD